MPDITGLATAYDLTIGVEVDMDEAIWMLGFADSPMITGVAADGLSVISTKPAHATEIAWMDDELLTPRTLLNGAATTGDTVITITTGDRTRFSTGDVLKIAKAGASETLRITGYGTTAETLLVTRAYTGTATNYADASRVIGLGTALPEGSDPERARVRDRAQNTNLTQIFGPTSIHLSATEQVIRKYGVPNEFSRQVFHRMQENVQAREQAFLYGVRSNSTTTKIRTMGGIFYYLTSNVDSTSTQLTVAKIQARGQAAFNKGGAPDRLMASPIALTDLTDASNTSIIRTEMMDSRRGRVPVSQVWSEFGPVTVVRNRYMLPTDAVLFRREQIVRRPLRPLVYQTLAKTGDADKGQIVCEESLEVKGANQAAVFTGLSYTE